LHQSHCLFVQIDSPAHEGAFFRSAFLCRTADYNPWSGACTVFQSRCGDFPEFYDRHIHRVVQNTEFASGVTKCPLLISKTVFGVDFILIFLLVNLYSQSGIGIGHLFGTCQPEHLYHVYRLNGCSFQIFAHAIHVNASDASSRMGGVVPFLTALTIDFFHLCQCGQCVGVLLYELKVRLATHLNCCYVLSGEVPYLMKYLLLKTSEDTFNRLALSVVGHCRFMQNGDLIKETLCGKFGMTALIVIYYFVWPNACEFYCLAKCPVLAVECFFRGNVIANQCFAIGIHHFIDGSGTHLSGFVPVV